MQNGICWSRASHWSIKHVRLAVRFWWGGSYYLSVRWSYLMRTKDNIEAHCAIHLPEPLGWGGQLNAAAGRELQLNLWAWNGKQWPFLSLPLNDHREGQTARVTGEESHMAELSAGQKGEFNSSFLWTEPLCQPFWNPVTFLPISEWKPVHFIPEPSGGVLSAMSLLFWPDCLLRKDN